MSTDILAGSAVLAAFVAGLLIGWCMRVLVERTNRPAEAIEGTMLVRVRCSPGNTATTAPSDAYLDARDPTDIIDLDDYRPGTTQAPETGRGA